MKRRSRSGGEATKARRRKTPEPKRRDAPKAAARTISPSAGKETEVARLTCELNQARGQQTATSEVLQVISSFAGQLAPVFQAILANATRLCEANFGNLALFENGAFRIVAMHNAPAAFAEFRQREPVIRPSRHHFFARVAATKRLLHVSKITDDPAYTQRDPSAASFIKLTGVQTFLAVPMLKDNELVGVIGIYRQEVRPFSDKQIALVTSFANQAVIAIENARLLNELRESLQQQTATSEVLRVISGSPGELKPVFSAMLENATRICEATFGSMLLRDGDEYRRVALHNAPKKFLDFNKNAPILRRGAARRQASIVSSIQDRWTTFSTWRPKTPMNRLPSSGALGPF
jgi:hypothetical protein